jgi:1-acyl-sn-glycerol-3-phosphate acyltransferase
MFVRFLYKVFRFLLLKIKIRGIRRIRGREPVVLVSNHAGAFGPLSIVTSFPSKLYTWVDHEVTEKDTVAKRIRAEFLEAELHLHGPFSAILSRVIGWICVALMKAIDVIPVYGRSKAIKATVDKSLKLLGQGKNILVFPEDSRSPLNGALCGFQTGFLHLARRYFQQTRKALSFIPVAVHRRLRSIAVGEPIEFRADNPFPVEKARLKRELELRVSTLYRSLESEGGLEKASGDK